MESSALIDSKALLPSSSRETSFKMAFSLTVSKCFCFSSLQLLRWAGGCSTLPPSLCPVDVRTSDIQHHGQLLAVSEPADAFRSVEVSLSPFQADIQRYILDLGGVSGDRLRDVAWQPGEHGA